MRLGSSGGGENWGPLAQARKPRTSRPARSRPALLARSIKVFGKRKRVVVKNEADVVYGAGWGKICWTWWLVVVVVWTSGRLVRKSERVRGWPERPASPVPSAS